MHLYLLEYRINRESEEVDDISRFKLDTSADAGGNVRSLTISWAFFGKEMGYSVRIIFCGRTSV
jgi:hypothetical protein